MSVAEDLSRPVVRELLESTIPARLAFLAADGSPRIAALWFHAVGEELIFATFPGTFKLTVINNGSPAAATIDTADFPYRGLRVRGPLTIEECDGIVPEYAAAARRYLGPETAETFLAGLAPAPTTRLRLAIEHAAVLDMRQTA